ncbi:HrgA protein [Sphingomonas sp. Leaf37]|uniref:HrgA protein n=1 Tax=Sphingomonas sp. Leaf37 TaxID=2876552 RepID=UPI001E5683F1|nr:HrgA protein [Sphingomonas sp. Leaf37]
MKTYPDQRFKAREIADWIHRTYPTETLEKMARSSFLETETALINQLVAEIGANRPAWQNRFGSLRTTEGRPRRYYWTEKTETEEVNEAEGGQPIAIALPVASLSGPPKQLLERDLYPTLIDFISSEVGASAFRINESLASNRRGPGGNKWLYPDIVAIEALTSEMNKEVVGALQHSGERRARLWSFEVKRLLNRSNVREAYFQAVSNSSWASFGYLVAAEIEGADTLQEIQMLYSVHGIGLIELDPHSPTESILRIPARERLSIEWSMCSRLADENRDFSSFMRRLRQFYQTGDL